MSQAGGLGARTTGMGGLRRRIICRSPHPLRWDTQNSGLQMGGGQEEMILGLALQLQKSHTAVTLLISTGGQTQP